MKEGDGPVNKTSRKSLKLLGTVGEPINPEAWMWYYRVVGGAKCPIVTRGGKQKQEEFHCSSTWCHRLKAWFSDKTLWY